MADALCGIPRAIGKTEERTSLPEAFCSIGETSLMMSLCPEGVDMEKFDPANWYSRSAKDSTKKYGDTATKGILEHLRRILKTE